MTALRADLRVISRWIRPGARVLDLGCGDGALLAHLRDAAQVSGLGLEIDTDEVIAAIGRSVDVVRRDIDAGLEDFEDGSFDYVIMSQTLQAVRYPDRLLNEMARVGHEGIVTFPNLGYWRCRVDLALRGRMPVSRALPHSWYATSNIHLCTIKDFEALCISLGLEVLHMEVVDHRYRNRQLFKPLRNLLCEIALYRFRRQAQSV